MKKLLKFVIALAVLAAIAFGVKTFFFDSKAETVAGPLVSTKVRMVIA